MKKSKTASGTDTSSFVLFLIEKKTKSLKICIPVMVLNTARPPQEKRTGDIRHSICWITSAQQTK